MESGTTWESADARRPSGRALGKSPVGRGDYAKKQFRSPGHAFDRQPEVDAPGGFRLLDEPTAAQSPLGHSIGYPPTRKLALTWKTALTIAKAMKPTKTKTPISTPLAMTLVKRFSCAEICRW
jgi:hypothetical protein